MQYPNLIIIAGCNGSGKSTFSKSLVNSVVPFDYDKRFLNNYRTLADSELRHQFAKQQTTKEFESSINGAFSNRQDFCYETNFDTHPLTYAEEAKNLGYKLHLIFYCLESLELANKRVDIRTENKGHFIPKETVEYKWKEGYKNLNLHYTFFDYLLIIDNSKHLQPPSNLLSLTKYDKDDFVLQKFAVPLPDYFEHRFPDIYKFVNK